jgi:hypothetical protein
MIPGFYFTRGLIDSILGEMDTKFIEKLVKIAVFILGYLYFLNNFHVIY